MKAQHPAKPWGLKEFFTGSGYYAHNTKGYVPKPESLIIPPRAPPAERTVEDQPFFHVPRNPGDPRTQVDISSGSASLTASQLIGQEALSRKNAAAASNALSMAEYIDNYPGMPEGAKVVMLHLKLDLVACCPNKARRLGLFPFPRTAINVKWSHRTIPLRPLEKINIIFEGKVKVKSNEDVLPPQPAPVGERLSEFVEGWKCITNDPYVLSIVTKGYRLCFTSPPLLRKTPWHIRSPQGPEEVLGMREQISLSFRRT